MYHCLNCERCLCVSRRGLTPPLPGLTARRRPDGLPPRGLTPPLPGLTARRSPLKRLVTGAAAPGPPPQNFHVTSPPRGASAGPSALPSSVSLRSPSSCCGPPPAAAGAPPCRSPPPLPRLSPPPTGGVNAAASAAHAGLPFAPPLPLTRRHPAARRLGVLPRTTPTTTTTAERPAVVYHTAA